MDLFSRAVSGESPSSWKTGSNLALAILIGNGATILAAGLLSHSFSFGMQVFALVFCLNAINCTLAYLLLPPFRTSIRSGLLRSGPNRLLLLCLALFASSILVICFSFPALLRFQDVTLQPQHTPLAMISAIFSSLAIVSALRVLKAERIKETRIWMSLLNHLPGLAVALMFFIVYLALGMLLSPPDFNTNNIYFAADSDNWWKMLASDGAPTGGARAVHPFAILLVRLPIRALALLLNGDWRLAGLCVLATAGSLCVFGVWMLVRNTSRGTFFPLAMASIFGASTSHILFSSIMEVYVFSALSVILFYLLLQGKRLLTPALLASGLVTFGLLLTNFVQDLLALTVVRPKAGFILRFVLLVLLLAVPLSLINSALYPGSELFFVPGNLRAEDRFATNISDMSLSEIRSRAFLLVKDMTMFNIIAPPPYISEQVKDSREPFPKFNFFNTSFYKYTWIGAIGLGLWMVILLYAGSRFILKGRSNHTLAFAALLNISFSFILHMNYGFEPFLYSENWTYAIVFLVSLSISDLSETRWLQALLLISLSFLMVNNARFIHSLIQVLAPYFG
jgi:hypothetical protein